MEGFYVHKLTGETAKLAKEQIENPTEERAEKLGLNYPSVAIEVEHGGYPRAYNQYPWLVEGMTHDGEEAIFMCCPRDYQFSAYWPEESEEIDEEDIRISDIGDIAIGKFFCSPPLCSRNYEGTEMPKNFRPHCDQYVETGIKDVTYKVFIAAGRSQHIVEAHLKRTAELDKAREAAQKAVEKIAYDADNNVFLGIKEDLIKKVRVDIRTDADGRQQVWLSAKTGGLNDVLRGENMLAVQNNDHFKAIDFDGHSYRIEPNKDTAEGKALAKLFERMSVALDIGAYWQLHNPTAPTNLKGVFHSNSKVGAKAPKLETVRGVHYLIYAIDETAEKDACYPPDAIPVNLKEYLWRKGDERDIQRGVKLPPPPEELSYMQPIRPSAGKPKP
ncbi:MAG TPA: hypothetical protein EYQ41_05140 [Micavibrio sp.]|nr:hypothetical protein [Micavibrio sp.]